MLYVAFTEDGIPDWIGPAPREGAEPVDQDLGFLVAHRRTAKGVWMKRTLLAPPKPTEADLAAQAKAEREDAIAARDVALRAALAEAADPVFFKWQRGESTKDDWLDAVTATKARFPKP
jgi:hypothetical protein